MNQNKDSTSLDESDDNKDKCSRMPDTSSRRRRAAAAGHVSFAPSVLADRPSTSRVTVVEEHGVYIDALGRRVAPSNTGASADGAVGSTSIPTCVVAAGKERITRSTASKHEKGHVGFAADDVGDTEMKSKYTSASSGAIGDSRVQYNSLTISLGLLKCGYRYQTTVPIHTCTKEKEEDGSDGGMQYEIVEIGESLDPDLDVEAVSRLLGDNVVDDTTTSDAGVRDHIQIRIATRRPGKYQSSFSVITRQIALTNDIGDDTSKAHSRHIVSVRVKATLLGKDQGKPQLKANIVKLGKLVGYDSDEETEWQGFPESDDDGSHSEGNIDLSKE